MRLLRGVGVVALLALSMAMGAGAAIARPINGDELTASIEGGSGLTIAAIIVGVGVASIGVLCLQRFLHTAVEAA